MSNLAYGSALLMGFGAAAAGTLGTVGELIAKKINKERHPILRTIGEVFFKTLQNAAALYALAIIGSLLFASNPVGLTIFCIIGTILVLTPVINAIAQQTNYDHLKKVTFIADQVTSGASKIINTAVLTSAVFMASGGIAAGVVGIGLSALNIAAFCKK